MTLGKKIKLREKRLADVWNDFSWQRDSELAELDAATVSTATYDQYHFDYANELCYPALSRQRFAVETLDGRHIGNCAYYGINAPKREAEVGIMIGDRNYWGKGYGSDTIITLVNYIFRHTKLKRVHLKTLDWNIRAQNCFQKCGFTYYSHMLKDGYNFLLMELSREQWAKSLVSETVCASDLTGRTAPEDRASSQSSRLG